MQRVRIGLTGLACVFVLVLLAAAFFGLAGPGEEPVRDLSAGNAHQIGNMVEAPAKPQEPLAELGVTPGGGGGGGGGADAKQPPAKPNPPADPTR